MYKETLFDMNLEDGDIPADKISTQGIEIFDTKNDTESLSLFEIGLKPQGLYYEYLQIANVKKYHEEHSRVPPSSYLVGYPVW